MIRLTHSDTKHSLQLKLGNCIAYRDLKEMNTKQAKISVEVMKDVMNDKTLKTKGDKDRRLREKKQNNTKKFMDERKYAQVKTFG